MKPGPDQNNWRPPPELPDLRRVGVIALDVETRDDGIRADRGSAWPWHGGYICGISVAWRAHSGICAHYFPIRHPDSKNFDPAQVFAWVKDLAASGVRIVTQNGLYDWGWLRTEAGILMPPSDRLEEIGALATLIDENRFNYGLNALCDWRGLPGKDETLMRQAVEACGFKVSKKNPLQSYIWQLPARYVGPYAEADPIATLRLFENLNLILDQEGTRAAYRLDVDLLPMVHEMRRRGIRVDQSVAEQARDYCLQKRDRALAELSEQLGSLVGMAEIASPIWKARTFDAHHVNYPRTEKGNPSFKAGKLGWMAVHPHWLPRLIATANKYEHAGGTLLESHILAHLIGDRIYGEINPHRSEESGTKSFRFSYSNPPLQQMPSRDKELGPLIRSAFLPEEGERWCTVDCSQQEFRFLVHHALLHNLPGAREAAELYRNNPDADFHAIVAEMTGLDRDMAKAVNFAKIYGAGVKKFAEMIGKPLSEAQAIYAQYDIHLLFVWQLSRNVQDDAVRLGYTVLYDNARRHWNLWEAVGVIYAKGAGPCAHEEAVRRQQNPRHPWYYRPLQRSGTYTALNALIQGSAARHTKLWMRACCREGIVPLLQMHDALECSVTTREQGELIARLGCDAVQLEVPMRVDLKFGKSWGDATHAWDARGNGAVPEREA
jgi:DNA polymerase I-like protein with 3'-5' exonuclease and polymerase domains